MADEQIKSLSYMNKVYDKDFLDIKAKQMISIMDTYDIRDILDPTNSDSNDMRKIIQNNEHIFNAVAPIIKK